MKITNLSTLIVILLLTGCQKPELIYTYNEWMGSDDAQQAEVKTRQVSHSKSVLWSTPSAWLETEGSALRIMTFISKDLNFPIETTIVQLSGQAGGIKANVNRWLGQLNKDHLNEKIIQSFIDDSTDFLTNQGKNVMLLDFSILTDSMTDEEETILAAIIKHQDQTVFIKMTGSLKSIAFHKNNFVQFVKSISLN